MMRRIMTFHPKRVLLGLVVLVLALAAAGVGLLALATHDRPLVRRDAHPPSAEALARVRAQLAAADPRRPAARPGGDGERTLRAEAADLDLLLADATRRLLRGDSRVALAEGEAVLQASVAWPGSPFGPWINLEARLSQTGGLPALASLRIGRVPVPSALAIGLARWQLERHGLASQADLVLGLVRRVELHPGEVTLAYVWRADVPDRLRATFVSPEDQRRLRAHAEHLAGLARGWPDPVSLGRALPPMMALAARRCAAEAPASGPGCDEAMLAQEHRAALVVLAMHAAGQPMARLVPQARGWPAPPARTVILARRPDFALHFLVSAVLAAEGGGRLADAIGVYKEIADTQGGSGFSFNDLGADRAGTRFGQVAVRDPRRASAALAGRAEAGVEESAFVPDLSDLPEYMPEEAFRATYGGVGEPAYERMMADIDRRVRAVPLLR